MSLGDFAAFQCEHRRLTILRFLAAAPGYEGNDALLAQALESVGLGASADQVAGDLAWLEEQRLIHTEKLGAVTVAQVSVRGVDVAHGRAVVPGVARPRPGEHP